jgi:hypothetical protein
MMSIERKYPISKSGPDITPKKIRSQACTVPIHDMADGVSEERRVVR